MLHAPCKNNVEDVKDIKQVTTDFNLFIYFLLKTLEMCMNYNVDPNMKSSNYSKIRFKPFIYVELQQSSN